MAIGRYVTHAAVLLVVVCLSGYATLGRAIPGGLHLRLGVVNSEGLVQSEGGQVGGVQLGRLSTIVKPVAIPTSALASHAPIAYSVPDGVTLKDLVARYGVSAEDIRWSNPSLLAGAVAEVKKGQQLLIPPVDGVVVVARQGDTPLSLGTAFHVSPDAIVDYNYLRTSAQDPLPAGLQVVIPGGRGQTPSRQSAATTTTPVLTGRSGAYTLGPYTGSNSVAAGNRFPYGYCTWFVYNRRPVPWLGNAWEWAGQAKAYGWATGQTPRPGAIMVTMESGFGHVGYVESVNPDGSWVVAEMNFRGFGLTDTRLIHPGGVPLLAFIY